jgi:hypothetical protein
MTLKRPRKSRSAQRPPSVPAAVRRAANEAAVQTFFAASDPAWRWVLILGLRDLRANASRLGSLAAKESPQGSGWSDDRYVYGPLVHGLTAAAVNECAQHCEDLFAVLMFLREQLEFAKRMLSYKAGTVTGFGGRLRALDDDAIRRLFIVPDASLVADGLAGSEDPTGGLVVFNHAVARLVERVRLVAEWYAIYEDFHIQYKHGLKLAMRPYGDPTPEAIDERRATVDGALLAFTSEPISAMVKGPAQQQGMIFPNLIPEVRAHLASLVEDRAVLRYKMSGPPVDLDEVVEISGTVVQLLRIAAANRLAIANGLREGAIYCVDLPGEQRYETVTVALELGTAPTLDDFRN